MYCHSPGYLAGKVVSGVREEQLVCEEGETTTEKEAEKVLLEKKVQGMHLQSVPYITANIFCKSRNFSQYGCTQFQ